MSVLDRLTNSVRQYAPTAPSLAIAPHLRKSAVEFCKRTRVWRHVVVQDVGPLAGAMNRAFDALPIEFGVYPNEPALATAAIHEIEQAWFDDEELEAIAFVDRDAVELASEGMPKYITQIDTRSIAIAPLREGRLRASLFLRPSESGQVVSEDFIPERIADEHGEAILHGALKRLLSIPRTDWHAPQDAMAWGAVFEKDVRDCFTASRRGQMRAPTRTRVSFGFR